MQQSVPSRCPRSLSSPSSLRFWPSLRPAPAMRPLRSLSPLAVAVALAPLAGFVGNSAAAPPSADEIIAESVAAMGGKEAIAKIDTLHAMSTITIGMTVVKVDAYWAKTGERLIRQGMQGMTMTTGYDGHIGWTVNPGGTQVIGKKTISQLDDQAGMHMQLLTMDRTAREQFSSVKSADDAPFAGRPCHRLRVVTTDEVPQEGYVYFDAETKLPAGWEMTNTGPNGPTTMQMTVSEWKETGGVRFFRKVEMKGPQELIMRYDKIEVNAIERDVFAPPPELRKQASAGGSGESRTLDDFSPEERAQIEQMLNGFMRMTNPDELEAAIKPMAAGLSYMTPKQQAAMKYVIERVEERVRELRGG